MRRRLDPGFLLLLTPFLWGLTFPATKLALGHLPVPSLMAWSRGLGLLTIIALLPLLRRSDPGPGPAPPLRTVLPPGLILGGLMFVGYLLQTEGQARTTATNAGFITGLYVVFAPILAALVFGQRIPRAIWSAVSISLAGLTLLSITHLDDIQLHRGDLLVLAGAIGWAGHIVAVGRYAPRHPAWMLSGVQMGVAAGLHAALALLGPGLRPAAAVEVWSLLILTGVAGSGVAFTIQVVAQRTVTPTRAVVLLAGESLVAAAAAAVWLGDRLSAHQWLGAAMVLAAMVYSELAARRPVAERLDPAVP